MNVVNLARKGWKDLTCQVIPWCFFLIGLTRHLNPINPIPPQ